MSMSVNPHECECERERERDCERERGREPNDQKNALYSTCLGKILIWIQICIELIQSNQKSALFSFSTDVF